jgi:hypothetical protein
MDGVVSGYWLLVDWLLVDWLLVLIDGFPDDRLLFVLMSRGDAKAQRIRTQR